jgi:hypothetical protein
MSNQNNSPSEALAQLIKPIVKEAVEEVLSRRSDPDRLLDASAAATLMAVGGLVISPRKKTAVYPTTRT